MNFSFPLLFTLTPINHLFLNLLEVYILKIGKGIKSMDSHHFSICVLLRSFQSLDQTPQRYQCGPCVTFSPPLAEAGLALQTSLGIYICFCEFFNLVLRFAITLIWAKWQQGERKWLILVSVVTALSPSFWEFMSDGHGQLCTAQDLALLIYKWIITHAENNRVWWEEKVQEWNQAIK